MDYPRYNRYLVFRRVGKDNYHIKNFLTEEEWEVSSFCAKFIKSLDGKTDPYDIFPGQLSDEAVDDILEEMKEEGFLDDGERAETLGIGFVIFPLCLPNITKVHRIIGAIWNKILIFIWLPLFIAGCYVFLNFKWEPVERGYGIIIGYILGLGLGMFLHELSHAFACIGYSDKNQIFEMGVIIQYFVPGAYVMMDYSEMRNRFAAIEC